MPVNILLSLSATLYRPDDSRRRSAHTSQMNEFRPHFHKTSHLLIFSLVVFR